MRRQTTGRQQANGPGRGDDETIASSHTPCACCMRAFFYDEEFCEVFFIVIFVSTKEFTVLQTITLKTIMRYPL